MRQTRRRVVEGTDTQTGERKRGQEAKREAEGGVRQRQIRGGGRVATLRGSSAAPKSWAGHGGTTRQDARPALCIPAVRPTDEAGRAGPTEGEGIWAPEGRQAPTMGRGQPRSPSVLSHPRAPSPPGLSPPSRDIGRRAPQERGRQVNPDTNTQGPGRGCWGSQVWGTHGGRLPSPSLSSSEVRVRAAPLAPTRPAQFSRPHPAPPSPLLFHSTAPPPAQGPASFTPQSQCLLSKAQAIPSPILLPSKCWLAAPFPNPWFPPSSPPSGTPLPQPSSLRVGQGLFLAWALS